MISGIIDLKVTDLTLSKSKAGISGHGLMTVLLLVWSPFSTVRGVQRNYYSLQNKVNKYSTTKGRGESDDLDDVLLTSRYYKARK
jgi:hypothetical protein